VISPLLGNIYLHYVFDLWAERWRRQEARGDAIVVRYADDLVAGFEHEGDARRFLDAMRERFEAFSLSLHPVKTRVIEFGRRAAVNRKKRGVNKPETFAFLGFTFICGKSRRGSFQLQRKTRRDRMRVKLQEIKAELRLRMHQAMPAQGHWLRQVVTGHLAYHAVSTNSRSLSAFRHYVTLRQTGGVEWFCVDIGQGRLDLEGCDISSQSLACVAIHGGADARLRRNRIHDGKQSGVLVYEDGQGTLEDNDVFENRLAGVEIQDDGSNPTLRRNRIRDGKEGGVYVHKSGKGVFEDNEISANKLAGIAVMGGANPILRRNRIHDGIANGVYVAGGGQGLFEDNDIFANAYSGVEIKESGNPTLRRNRIHHGRAGGVMVLADGQGILEDNEISANAEAGVTIWGGGNPSLRRNRISENGYAAIRVHDGGRGVIEDNDLRGNAGGAWDIAPDCRDNIIRRGNQE
jgi:parallel beta-helix repeat protein